MTEHAIEAPTHGRYLAVLRDSPALLVGFHGYGESADDQMERLQRCPGSEDWSLVSIQGLNRFYQRRARRVVACWMTSQNRELAIADNAAYVSAVLARVRAERAVRLVVCAGFSQGVAMAFRAATRLAGRVARHVVAVGGDVPPELRVRDLARLSSVLVCRGRDDELYRPATFARDLRRLRGAGVPTARALVAGPHEWSPGVDDAVSRHLARLRLTARR